MAGEAQIQFTIKLLRPSDPTEVGSEALRLARSISQITRDELIQITEPVRAGFKENFETESAAGDPWQVLAKRTQDEREELGFDREHPILVRKGDYKKSWLDVNDPNNALELTEKGFYMGGGEFLGSNVILIMVGSNDPRVPKLSGAEMEMASAFEAFDVGSMPGVVPPRPVHKIMDHYADVIGWSIEGLLTMKAEEVK